MARTTRSTPGRGFRNTGWCSLGLLARRWWSAILSLFVEAGIKIASFTFSAAVLYSALRILSDPPADGFLAIGGGEEMEAYGESPAHPVLSAVLDQPLERSAALAAAELRLDPEAGGWTWPRCCQSRSPARRISTCRRAALSTRRRWPGRAPGSR